VSFYTSGAREMKQNRDAARGHTAQQDGSKLVDMDSELANIFFYVAIDQTLPKQKCVAPRLTAGCTRAAQYR
jgi:hypothetical protein